jgi:hypothetical protein
MIVDPNEYNRQKNMIQIYMIRKSDYLYIDYYGSVYYILRLTFCVYFDR